MHPVIEDQITFVYTRDMEASANFYEQVLGLTLKVNQGGCRIYHVTEHSYLGVCLRDDAPEPQVNIDRRNIILTLVTTQVDEWFQYLQEREVAFEKTPQTNENYNIYHCFLRDPNGYLIEIQHFLDPDWLPVQK